MVQVSPNRMSLFEHKHRVLFLDVPHGHTLEQMMEPKYWAHNAMKMRPGDEIVAVAEDNSFRAEFHVLDVGPNWANVYCFKFDQLTAQFELPADADSNFIIEYSGNYHKWRVRRKDDKSGKPLIAFLKDRPAALAWLANYKKTLQRDEGSRPTVIEE